MTIAGQSLIRPVASKELSKSNSRLISWALSARTIHHHMGIIVISCIVPVSLSVVVTVIARADTKEGTTGQKVLSDAWREGSVGFVGCQTGVVLSVRKDGKEESNE